MKTEGQEEAESSDDSLGFETDSEGAEVEVEVKVEVDPLALPDRDALFAARYRAISSQPGLRNFEPQEEYLALGFAGELEGLKAKYEEASDTMSAELRAAISKEITVYGGSSEAAKAARDAANQVAGDLDFLA